MNRKVVLENLEIHVAHACNLACESCTHFSNQGHKGLVSLEEAEAWMAPWSRRLAPRSLSLLGGEPTLHPRLGDWLRLARRHFPEAVLRIVTNGFFLDRHPDLPRVMLEVGNARLFVSVHHHAPEYMARVQPMLDLALEWRDSLGIRVNFYPSSAWWQRTYKDRGGALEPFDDGDPRASWSHCLSREARQLFEGRLYKCSPLAYLKLEDRHRKLSPAWAPYLAYRPLEPDCPDAELEAFLALQEEPFCGMCPARPETVRIAVPFRSSPRPE
ncbi:MAG: radical SAM protein [Planctomycetota bacterium]|nr:radical SAM protein [Planctomycetota bacterium]